MSVEKVIMLFCEPKKDDYVAKAAAAIRKVLQCLKNEMPWPPHSSDPVQSEWIFNMLAHS